MVTFSWFLSMGGNFIGEGQTMGYCGCWIAGLAGAVGSLHVYRAVEMVFFSLVFHWNTPNHMQFAHSSLPPAAGWGGELEAPKVKTVYWAKSLLDTTMR